MRVAAGFVCVSTLMSSGAAIAQQAAQPAGEAQLPEVTVTQKAAPAPAKKAAAKKQSAPSKAKSSAPAPSQSEPVDVPQDPVAATGTGTATAVGTSASLMPTAATSLIGAPPPVYAGGQVAVGTRLGVLGDRNIFSAPFSVSSFTEKLIEDRQFQSLADIARYESSVVSTGARGTFFDGATIRGFTAPFLFDGLTGPYSRGTGLSVDEFERIEVLKGPVASLVGALGFSPGGSVNLVPKRGTAAPVTDVELRYLSGEAFGTHLDVGRRYGVNKEWGVRANGTLKEGEINVEGTDIEHSSGHLAIDYRGEDTRFSLDFNGVRTAADGGSLPFTLATGLKVPDAPELDRTYSQKWTDYPRHRIFGVARAEHDFAENWTVGFASSVFRHREKGEYDGVGRILNANGDYQFETALDYDYEVQGTDHNIYLKGKAFTGPLTHTVSVDASTGVSQLDTTPFIAYRVNSNLNDPVYEPAPDGIDLTTDKALWRQRKSYIVADEIAALDDRVILTLAGRRTEILQERFDVVTGIETQDVESSKFTPILGLLVKPIAPLSLYVSYGEALEYGIVAPNTAANAMQVTDAIASKQYEAGAKLDFGSFGVTAAWFEITRDSAFTDPASNRFGVFGAQVHEGVEAQVFGEPVPGLRLIAGATYLEPILAKTAGGAFDGNDAPNVPRLRAVATVEGDVPWLLAGLAAYGTVAYTSDWYLDATNLQEAPDFATLDLGLIYRTQIRGTDTALRLAIENVTDEQYWAPSSNNNLLLGTPRTVLATTSFKF